ncbi:hypothetical protein QBC33DRAFT_621626 [Phialemonium atrogriseum]|uniref:Uncharacterized protein n=1 Tax=Phialemonium atrogriseum TaxID=1093897 RepID=A0AAJ0FDW9_9PEZI|nr:uncharacterized protein QBC33DRAFT_621626 [Phialemonium atrogriseum]KAK1765011.1 hypothetical protein QBC33DRAFT_621626 [Phialemonium atrogriseum]
MIDLFRCCERVITEEGIIIETSNHFLEPGEVLPQPGPSQRSPPKDDKKGNKDGKKDKKKDKNKGSSTSSAGDELPEPNPPSPQTRTEVGPPVTISQRLDLGERRRITVRPLRPRENVRGWGTAYFGMAEAEDEDEDEDGDQFPYGTRV